MMNVSMGEAPENLEELEAAAFILDKLTAPNAAGQEERIKFSQMALDYDSGKPIVLDYTGDVDGGGVKASMYDNYVNKPPMELVPCALTKGCARALGYGAEKYAPNNWRRGMRWGEVFGAIKRHLDAWNEGEDFDTESNLNHLDHVAACLSFLMHMATHEAYSKMDDRP